MRQVFTELAKSFDTDDGWHFGACTCELNGICLWTANGWGFFTGYECGFDIPLLLRPFLWKKMIEAKDRITIKKLRGGKE
jgi:hypothetical protein